MAEETAFGIQLIRDCILNHITSFQDLKNISLLNRPMYEEVWKRLESKSVVRLTNQQINEYADEINEPIIKGKYISIIYSPDEKYFTHKEFNQALRAKAGKSLLLLEPRINELRFIMGSYETEDEVIEGGLATAEEIVTLLKSSRNVSYLNWDVEGSDEDIVLKFFEEVKDLLDEEEYFSFDNAKTLEIDGTSEIVWDFWANVFIHLFPNLENLQVGNNLANSSTISKSLEIIDDLGKLETLHGLLCAGRLMGRIWNRFLEKSFSFTKFQVEVCGFNISYFKLFLGKYKNQLEDIKLFLAPGFGSLRFPPMCELRKLGLWFRRGHVASQTQQLLIAEDEDAYPKLVELYLAAFDIEALMVCFRNISKNSGLSAEIQKTTALFQMNIDQYFEWIESGQENGILEELNLLFPNADNKIQYDQMDYYGYPDLSRYKRNTNSNRNRKKRRCVIL